MRIIKLILPVIPQAQISHVISNPAKRMTLFVVGLGLADEKDITVRGLECVRRSSRVFLEQYTSILLCDTQVLEDFYGRKIEIADRELVEGGSDVILDAAESDNASFLVVGDPFG